MRSFVFCVLSFVLSLSTVALPVTFAAEDATEYSLRYKFTPAEFVHYDVDSQNTIEVQLNQDKENTKNSTNTLKHYRVIWVDEEGNGTLETMIDRVQMSVQFDDQVPATFDSKLPKEKDLKQFEKIRGTIGKASRIVYTPLGKVVTKDGKPETQTSGFLIPLPENQVKIGDSWKEEYDVEVSVGKTLRKKVPIHRIFTLDSVENQIAVITFKTKILLRLNDPKLGLQLIQKTPSGTIKLDLDRGIIISQDVSLDKAQVGVFEGQGAMRAVSTRIETLVDPASLAQKDADPIKK
ncbi:DUF6263 family protein [uncultured Gimesia sp.]|uniref:DUF6263 family protein n=1 Tax=uncultured Gimesia sp. TaxID=1678688 RepID=UPI0030D82B62|tara:strand:- start:26040 stop:26918 length:879 start_codon:yes stop_codon:yes gene_type:complete